MVQVIWAKRAVADIIAIRTYIGAFNPAAADRMSQRLEDAANSLEENPARGMAIHHGLRQLAIVRPYLIRYRVLPTMIEIVTIRHSARKRAG